MNCLRIINEPTAAALAFSKQLADRSQDKIDHTILVFDLGGGTLDVSILNISRDKISDEASKGDITISVEACRGDNNLGGIDFTDAIFNHCAEIFKEKTGIRISKETYPVEYQELWNRCDQAKI